MGISLELIVSLIVGVLGSALLIFALQKVPRTKGSNLKYHGIFVACAAAIIFVVPLKVRILIFSPFGIRVVGNIFPLYQSILAVSTPETSDDKLWLQFWISQGMVFYASEWIEDFTDDNLTLYLYFYHFELFFYLWLYLPYTDGAALIFEKFTEPLLAPIVKPIAKKFEGWISMLVSTAVSASHIWIVWAAFVFFPAVLKRFVTVSVGTVYPIVASIVAVTTPQGNDDTFWLTYWSCYGVLFLAMDWAENYIGKFPGFYLVVLVSTVYLMVPMFNGAEKVYRNILVPLTSQQEMLIYRDALAVKKDMLKMVPKARNSQMRIKLAALFAGSSDDEEDSDNNDEKKASLSGYQSIV